jgi:hypothetical protein
MLCYFPLLLAIDQAKKITTGCDLSLILKRTFSLSVFPLYHLLPLKTFAKSGFQKFTTTAQEFLASLWELSLICEKTPQRSRN